MWQSHVGWGISQKGVLGSVWNFFSCVTFPLHVSSPPFPRTYISHSNEGK